VAERVAPPAADAVHRAQRGHERVQRDLPSTSTAERSGSKRHSRCRNGRQAAISSGVGLFAGGAQRAAAAT
jgi:hypothetical protein